MPDEIKAVSGPVLIQVGDSDAMMPIDQVNTAKEIFTGKSNAEVTVFPGAVHGFSVGLIVQYFHEMSKRLTHCISSQLGAR